MSLSWKDGSWSANTLWLYGKEQVPGAAVSKENDADSLLEHEKTHHDLFPSKRCHYKQYFLLLTPLAKIHFIYWMTSIYSEKQIYFYE